MDDLNTLVSAVTREAYELANKTGRLSDRIDIKANFDMDLAGQLRVNQSRRFPGAINVQMQLAPGPVPTGIRLLADYAARAATRGLKKNTQKRTNHAILYQRQGGYCAGCDHFFQSRNLTIDHIIPRSIGGASDIANYQLLCHACNQLKGDGSQEQLMAELRVRGYVNRGLSTAEG